MGCKFWKRHGLVVRYRHTHLSEHGSKRHDTHSERQSLSGVGKQVDLKRTSIRTCTSTYIDYAAANAKMKIRQESRTHHEESKDGGSDAGQSDDHHPEVDRFLLFF